MYQFVLSFLIWSCSKDGTARFPLFKSVPRLPSANIHLGIDLDGRTIRFVVFPTVLVPGVLACLLDAAWPRAQLALEDVRLIDADVVALQEVDRSWYQKFWEPHMTEMGFTAVGYTVKTGARFEGWVCARLLVMMHLVRGQNKVWLLPARWAQSCAKFNLDMVHV